MGGIRHLDLTMKSPPASPEFLDQVVVFPDGASYGLLCPITEYRTCHLGTPLEACIVYTCRKTDGESGLEYVVKIKVQ